MTMDVSAQRVIDFMAAQIAEQAKTIATLQARNEHLEMLAKAVSERPAPSPTQLARVEG